MSPPVSLPEAQAVSLVVLQLIRFLFPLVVTSAGLVLLGRLTDLELPTWAIATLACASIPAYTTAHVLMSAWRIERKAARLGAVVPPRLKGKKFGHIDLLFKLSKGFESDYLSESPSAAHGVC